MDMKDERNLLSRVETALDRQNCDDQNQNIEERNMRCDEEDSSGHKMGNRGSEEHFADGTHYCGEKVTNRNSSTSKHLEVMPYCTIINTSENVDGICRSDDSEALLVDVGAKPVIVCRNDESTAGIDSGNGQADFESNESQGKDDIKTSFACTNSMQSDNSDLSHKEKSGMQIDYEEKDQSIKDGSHGSLVMDLYIADKTMIQDDMDGVESVH